MVQQMHAPPTDSEFMGMMDYVPKSVHDLLANDPGLSDSHSSSGSHHPSQECFMADIQEHPEDQGEQVAVAL